MTRNPICESSVQRYVEVIGEGQFAEAATYFVAEVVLEVRAAKEDTALREVRDLWQVAVTSLRDAGVTDAEMVEGGADFSRPWYWKKNVGQSAVRKIVLKVSDFARLNDALEKLEPLQSRDRERKTVRVDMRQPVFDASVATRAAALASAFADAQAKAQELATAMQCRLGPAIHVEEGGSARRASGFSGDEDWGGDFGRFPVAGAVMLAAGASASEEEMPLQNPTRTIFVKCRARFEVVSKGG